MLRRFFAYFITMRGSAFVKIGTKVSIKYLLTSQPSPVYIKFRWDMGQIGELINSAGVIILSAFNCFY